jgi:hypothetical protein
MQEKEDPLTVTRQPRRVPSLNQVRKEIPSLLLQFVRKEITSLSLGKKGGSPHFHHVRYEYLSLLRRVLSWLPLLRCKKGGGSFTVTRKKGFRAAGRTNHFCRPHTLISSKGVLRAVHGLNNYKDTNPKCRLYWCLREFIDWRFSQSCWHFRPA